MLTALQAGASGFLLKDVSKRSLAEAVRQVHEGGTLLAPSITLRLVERRLEREIGARLHLSESTVKTYVGQLLAETGCRDRVHLVILGFRAGLVTP